MFCFVFSHSAHVFTRAHVLLSTLQHSALHTTALCSPHCSTLVYRLPLVLTPEQSTSPDVSCSPLLNNPSPNRCHLALTSALSVCLSCTLHLSHGHCIIIYCFSFRAPWHTHKCTPHTHKCTPHTHTHTYTHTHKCTHHTDTQMHTRHTHTHTNAHTTHTQMHTPHRHKCTHTNAHTTHTHKCTHHTHKCTLFI